MVLLDPKYNALKIFYKLLSDFENQKPINNKRNSRKGIIQNNVN